jgi:hypothetical protein
MFEILEIIILSLSLSTAIGGTQSGGKLDKETRFEYSRHIVKASAAHEVDPFLIAAVMWNESGFTNATVNRTKDYGVMQVHWQKMGIHEHWLRGLTKKDLMDPETNIWAGVEELVHWRSICRRRKHTKDQHSWLGHYKWGNVVRSRRYEERVLRRKRKLLRNREDSEDDTLRRGPQARRGNERGTGRQVPRSPTSVSVVSMYQHWL